MKSHKLMEIEMEGHGDFLICVKDSDQKYNPYIIYLKFWKNGWKRRKLNAYCTYESAVWFIFEVLTGKIRL